MVAVNVNPPDVEPGISPELLYEKIEFKPHSKGQREYLLSNARFNIPCCGRRYGKSKAAGHRMTLKAFKPETFNWIVGTSYRIGEKEFRVVWEDFQKLGILKYCKKSYAQNQGDMRIQTPWNSLVLVVSADNQDSLLGEGLSHAILSEAAKHKRDTWEQFIEPALADFRGSADFPSTPQGYNWFHGLWMLGQESNLTNPLHKAAGQRSPLADPAQRAAFVEQNHDSIYSQDYKSWSFPTWENSVRFPGGFKDPEIQRVLQTVSKHWFDQEYGAKFTSMTGAIFHEWDDKIHVIDHHDFRPDWPNFLAFDYGYANAFVCLDIQINPANDQVIVWREYYMSGMSTMDHGFYLRDRENPEGYHVDGMWGDPRGADEAATLAMIIGYVASEDVRWKLSIEEMKRMLKNRPPLLLTTKTCRNLNRQMGNLHVKEQGKQAKFELNEQIGDGNIQHKMDDHAVDALRYFIGPYFVQGAGASLTDIYGDNYRGSESEDFFKIRTGVTLTDDIFNISRPF